MGPLLVCDLDFISDKKPISPKKIILAIWPPCQIKDFFSRSDLNKMAYTAKDPTPPPPWRFLYLTETKSWRCEEEGETDENVHLKTHATARGMGKNVKQFFLTPFGALAKNL